MIDRRALLVLAAALPGIAMADERVDLEGVWRSTLGGGGEQVGLTFAISGDRAGQLTVHDPGGADTTPLRVTSDHADRIVIEAAQVKGRFEGAAMSVARLEGRWIQGSANLPMVLTRAP